MCFVTVQYRSSFLFFVCGARFSRGHLEFSCTFESDRVSDPLPPSQTYPFATRPDDWGRACGLVGTDGREEHSERGQRFEVCESLTRDGRKIGDQCLSRAAARLNGRTRSSLVSAVIQVLVRRRPCDPTKTCSADRTLSLSLHRPRPRQPPTSRPVPFQTPSCRKTRSLAPPLATPHPTQPSLSEYLLEPLFDLIHESQLSPWSSALPSALARVTPPSRTESVS